MEMVFICEMDLRFFVSVDLGLRFLVFVFYLGLRYVWFWNYVVFVIGTYRKLRVFRG